VTRALGGGLVRASAEPAPSASVSVPSLREIFDAHGAYVVRNIRRMGVPEPDVEDVAQDLFVVVHRKLGQYDGSCALRTWLFAIARRVVADYRKRAHRRRELVTEEVHEQIAGSEGLENEMAMMERALEGVEWRRRMVFVLYELEGQPMPEVAATVGCPLSTAYRWLQVARDHVRAALERELAGKGRLP